MKQKTALYYLLVCLILGIGRTSLAVSIPLHFKQIALDDGLSQNSVFCILQDQKGFLWFGTQDGLNKYDGYNFTIYNADPENPNSLSFNWINAIYEDSNGLIWIGTNLQGVNTFDPQKETFYRYPIAPNANSPYALNNGIITAIVQDRSGDMWFATRGGGLSRLHRQLIPGSTQIKEYFTHYRAIQGQPKSLSSNFINTLYIDHQGTLWIGTYSVGLSKYNPKTNQFIHYRNNPNAPNSLSNNYITNIYEDDSGNFWVATGGGGLNMMDRSSGTFLSYQNIPGNPNSLGSNVVNAIYEDRSGILWIGTNDNGLCRFDKRTESFINYRHNPQDPTSLSNNSVQTIYEDRSRVLWLGTSGGGLNRFDRENKFQLFRSDLTSSNSLSDNFIYAIYEDRQGVLWIGTNSGGLNEYHRDTQTFIHHRNNPADDKSIGAGTIRSILEDSTGTLWVSTQGSGLNRFDRKTRTFTHFQADPQDPTSLSYNSIRVMAEDSNHNLWIGTSLGGLDKLNRESETFTHYRNIPSNPSSIADNQIYALYAPPSEPDILWVGTASAGLDCFNTQTGIAQHFPAEPSNPRGFSHNCVLAILEDHSGTLWIGTYGGGLNKMIKQPNGHHYFVRYTEKNGLPNNSIYGLLEDAQGLIWISTNKGLSCFNPKTETFKNYNVRDGLQGNEFNSGSFFKNKNGEMFFGGLNGMNSFFPFKIQNNPHIPPIVITNFKLFNKSVTLHNTSPLKQNITWTKEIHLTYKQNAFSFEFAALDFTIPENNIYYYKMENLDEDWNYTNASQRFATYTNMPPGTYIFTVKGSNNDGLMNQKGTSIRIIIAPPFWQTWWFRLMVLVSLLVLWVSAYRRRLRNDRLKFELQTAHDAQMSIMPQTDPYLQGYDISGICVPANEVGGDFFDYIWMNEEKTKLCIVIGDVSGKAMKSAMTAVLTSGMIYSQVAQCDSVQEIMQQVNRPLFLKTNKSIFTALILAAIELPSRRLTFCNAGLHAPFIITSPDYTISALNGEGKKLPLGIRIDTPYLEKHLFLNSGDIIIFFTDGITDAKNLKDEFYGENRLTHLLENSQLADLTACEIKDTIIADVNQFSENTDQHDDITLVVLKVL